jgi:sugar-specific transcriptional regulator TrmB
MPGNVEQPTAVEVLQELGLKQYEARCFVALARIPHGTAKEISEVAEVPRTRVYDAVEALEAEGLVDVQQSSPQRFRAIPVGEAVGLLRRRFEARFETLDESLGALEPIEEEGLRERGNVWTTHGEASITDRAIQFVDAAESEVVLVVDGPGSFSEELLDRLGAATDRGVAIYVGALSETSYEQVRRAVPDAQVFESGLEWLQPQPGDEADEQIARLLMVDRETLLLSSVGSESAETAIWSEGVGNGLIVIARRLLATGLDESADPGRP